VASLDEAGNVKTRSGILDRLRADYEERGFSFVVAPGAESLPDFLGSYRPDAIAQKEGENVIIEIIRQQHSPGEQPLADLREGLANHKDWKLNIIYARERPEDLIVIPVPRLDMLKQQIAEVETLEATGHHRAAFVLSWSVLEAVLNRVKESGPHRIRAAGQVVQTLTMDGHIGAATERKLRELSDLRNRIVHGDLDADASGEDVEQVLAAIDEALVGEKQ
jgi:uncharacterized protein YutE (UPF0331/DUF86 family)